MRNLLQTDAAADGVPRKLIVEPRAELRRFLDVFGPTGGEMMAAGLSFQDAAARRIRELKAENAELRRRLEFAEPSTAQ